MRRLLWLVVALSVTAVGCSACRAPETLTPVPFRTAIPPTGMPPGSPTTGPASTAAPPQAASPEAGATPTVPLPEPPDPIEEAIKALSREIGVPPGTIALVEAMPVQWNDSSLGCPQPGTAYLQVITPGYLVTLSAGETTYRVHTDLAGSAVVCFNEGDPIGAGTVPDPIAAEFIMQARTDLAQRLGVPPQAVALVRSEAVDWSDSSLGCRQEGEEEVIKAITPGYRIVLAYGEERFEYHTDQQRMVACAEPTE